MGRAPVLQYSCSVRLWSVSLSQAMFFHMPNVGESGNDLEMIKAPETDNVFELSKAPL